MSKVARSLITIAFTIVGSVLGGPIGAMIGTFIGTAVGKLLIPPSKGKARAASAATVQIGEGPRQAGVGRVATAGGLVDCFNYGGKYGTDWEVLVLDLLDHRCDALEGFYVNDSYIAFAGDGMVAGYNNQLAVYFRNGTESQTVPAILTANGAGWTANDNGAGISYVVVAYKSDDSDAKNPVWPNGRPRFLWVVRAALCYDPRKDSTAGGVGAHRWLTPSTWEWSENPIVTRYKFARGFFACDRITQPDQLLVGRGLTAVEAPPVNLFPRANLCDELVGGQKRYRVGGVIEATETFLDVENDFAAACAGTIVQPEGAVEIDPGEARAAVITITDKDLVVGSKVKRRWFLGIADRDWINSVVASYVEPGHKWQPHAAPVRRETADIIADGGPREETLQLGFVTWILQAGRIAEIVRRLGRLHIRAEIVLPPRLCELEEGDWIVWQSDRYLKGQAFTFRIEAWGSDRSWQHSVILRQISATCYSDTAALTDGSVAVLQPPRDPIGAPSAANWSLASGHLDAGGVRTPALIVTGASEDPSARFIRMEYCEGAAAPTVATIWNDVGVTGPDLKRREIAVAAGGIYRVAISYIVDGVQGDRLVLGPVNALAVTYPDGTPIDVAYAELRSFANFTQPTTPSPTESVPGNIWLNTSTGIYYRRVNNGGILLGGFVVTLGGNRPVIYWTEISGQPLLDALTAAAAAQATADSALATANAAADRLLVIDDDGILDKAEKVAIFIPNDTALEDAYQSILSDATDLELSTAALTAARAAYRAFRDAISPAWNSITTDSPIARGTLDVRVDAFRSEINALGSAINLLLANNVPYYQDISDIVVDASYTGAVNAGELPITIAPQRYLANINVTELASWSVTPVGGITLSAIDNSPISPMRGQFSVTAVSAINSTFVISSIHKGLTIEKTVKVTRKDGVAPAPAGGGGGGGAPGSPATDNTFAVIGASGADIVISDVLDVVVGSSGQVDLTAPLAFNATQNNSLDDADESNITLTWEYSANGTSGWSAVGASQVSSDGAYKYFSLDPPRGLYSQSGSVTIPRSKTGLTSGAHAFFRLLGRRSSGLYEIASISGTATARPI